MVQGVLHEDVCAGFSRSEVLDFYTQFLERRNGHELKPRFSVPEIFKVLRENQPQRLFVVALHEDTGQFQDDNSRDFLSDSSRSRAENDYIVIFWQQTTTVSPDKIDRPLAVLIVLIVF